MVFGDYIFFARKIYTVYNETPTSVKGTIMNKEKLVFALYVATAVATTASAGVTVYNTFKSTKEERKFRKAAKQSNKVANIK